MKSALRCDICWRLQLGDGLTRRGTEFHDALKARAPVIATSIPLFIKVGGGYRCAAARHDLRAVPAGDYRVYGVRGAGRS